MTVAFNLPPLPPFPWLAPLFAGMLAAASHDIPLREHSHLNLSDRPQTDNLALEDRLCPGCKTSVVNEQGGLVVAFGLVPLSIFSITRPNLF